MYASSYDAYLYYSGGSSYLVDSTANFTFITIRPVINLKDNVKVAAGNGTSTNPYVIKTN